MGVMLVVVSSTTQHSNTDRQITQRVRGMGEWVGVRWETTGAEGQVHKVL